MVKILIIEDDSEIRDMITIGVKSYGYEVSVASDGNSARELLKGDKYDVVISDLVMPDVKGTELIDFIKDVAPESKIIVMTAHASVKVAKECVQKGASSFVIKPFSMEQMYYTIETALMEKKLMEEEETSYEDLISENIFFGMAGKSLEMKKIYHTILTIAKTDSPVIIYGETGTGKELAARAIHLNSDRGKREMLVVDCGALSEHLFQSELFGYVKGAFTGAFKDKIGLLKAAAGSTILLDEIGEISPQAQSQLLRFLQNGEFRPVGGTHNIRSDARVLAATNVDLEEKVNSGHFREDLYHRLNVLTISLPPLREHREDIPLLSYYFLRNFAGQQKKPIKNISSVALSVMMARNWPGNVRELENTIERAVTFCLDETILPYHLSPGMEISGKNQEADTALSLSEAIHRTEKEQIVRAMRESKGNKQEAARLLGIDRITLWRKIKAYNLNIPTFS
jgi:two-component system, NtrC family, response regulator AtoC